MSVVARILSFEKAPRTALTLVIVLFATRILGLMVHGPILTFDSHGYVQYADLIASDTRWLHQVRLDVNLSVAPLFRPDSDSSVITLTRLPGYPLLIAFSKAIFGSSFAYFLVVVNAFVTAVVALYALSLVARLDYRCRLIGFIGVFLVGMSHALFWDMSVMTDSLFSSILVAAVLLLSRVMSKGDRVSPIIGAVLGGLFVTLTLLRDLGYPLLLLLFTFVLTRQIVIRKFRASLIGLIFMFAPGQAITTANQYWNEYRTGSSFTTLQSYTLLRPLISSEMYGHRVVDRSSLVYRALDEVRSSPDGNRMCAIARVSILRSVFLNEDNHARAVDCADFVHRAMQKEIRNSVELTRLVRAQFLRFGMSRPHLLLRYMFEEILPMNLIDTLSASPFISIFAPASSMAHGSIMYRKILENWKKGGVAVAELGLILFDTILKLMSVALLIVFGTGTILVSLSKLVHGNYKSVLLFHFLLVAGLYFFCSLVHVEPRYLLSVHFMIVFDACIILGSMGASRTRV